MAVEWNSLIRTVLPTSVLGVAAFTLCSQPASAFFPPVPTGSGQPGVVVPPVVPPPVIVPPLIPPVVPPPFVPPLEPPVMVPPVTTPPVIRPTVVPEPATVITAGIGLALAAGLRRRRKESEK
jgi:hypothetical protein